MRWEEETIALGLSFCRDPHFLPVLAHGLAPGLTPPTHSHCQVMPNRSQLTLVTDPTSTFQASVPLSIRTCTF